MVEEGGEGWHGRGKKEREGKGRESEEIYTEGTVERVGV